MTEASKQLIGKREKLAQLDHRLNEEPFRDSLFQIRGRQFIMEQFCKFTSKNSHNHAMTIGEYAVLYLMAWSPALWKVMMDEGYFLSFEEAVKKNKMYFVFNDASQHQDEHEIEIFLDENRYYEHVAEVEDIYQTIYSTRRLLANIPTYMIFDDHDITDDWNINLDWKKNVNQSNPGRHVIANGLAAYWLFQGWGNDPTSFSPIFLRKMAKYFKSYQLSSYAHDAWETQLLKYDSWNFVAPTKPKAIFLDTRTQREFDLSPVPLRLGRLIKEKESPPQLIGKNRWQKISDCLFKSGWSSGEQLFVISPTPVYGIRLIESFLHQYIYPLKIIGFPVNTTFDFEAWKYNGEGFSEMLHRLKDWNASRIYILSGDVHYASAVTSKIEFRHGEHLCLHQFTSSPMNNMSFPGLWGGLLKKFVNFYIRNRRKKELSRYCNEGFKIIKQRKNDSCPSTFTWREKIRYLATDNNNIIELDNNIGLLTLSADSIQNTLLQKDKELQFETINLSN
ncbi:hypothetical protein ACLM5H_11465 [Fredinandcohnia humi]